jgi:glycosyltransferase involved in cell wall biosynthesis
MPRRITPARDALALAELRGAIRRWNPAIVHAHTVKGGLLGMVAAGLAGTPVRIYQMRGLLMETAVGWRRALFASTERVACAAAHRVLCNSASLRDTAIRERLCGAAKIEVLLAGSGNGVDAVRFDPERLASERVAVRRELGIPEGAPVVGFVGRLVRDKGIGELVQAWGRARESVSAAHLAVIGSFEERDAISVADRSALATCPTVHLLGFRRDMPRLYAAMDLLVLPTYREGFPNVLLEAQAMRVPVVATRVDGCVDAVDEGVTGTLVPPGDAGALADAIRAYLGDSDLAARHGRAGRERVLRLYDRERLWEALLGVYERSLGGSRTSLRSSRFAAVTRR